MNTFEYTIIDLENTIYTGTIKGFSKKQIRRKLSKNGMSVVSLAKMQRQISWASKFISRISRLERIVFLRNLNTMMQAGLTLTDALSSARDHANSAALKAVIADIEQVVYSGQSLTSGFKRHPKVFSPITIAMIQVGERGGKLTEALDFMVQQQESDYRLRRRVQNALVYPSLILVTMVAMVALMMIMVIPRIAEVYAEASASLPFITWLLIQVSTFVSQYFGYIILIVGLTVYVSRLVLRTSRRVRRATHGFLLRVRMVGPILKKMNLLIVSRSLYMLIRAGVSIDRSLHLTSEVTTNLIYKESLEHAESFMKRGVKLSDVFKGSPDIYLPLFYKMVVTGERTGNLDDMLGHVTRYYEDDIQNWAQNLSSLIEPILLLGTGAVVGTIAVAIMFPMWNLVQVL